MKPRTVQLQRRTQGHFATAVSLSLVALLLTSSCSLFAPSDQQFSVSSDPSGAEVVINGRRVGTTPLITRIPRKTTSSIIVRKTGYEPVVRQTSRTLSTVGIVDVVGTAVWLIPGIGLFAPGAYAQTPENMSVILPPADRSK